MKKIALGNREFEGNNSSYLLDDDGVALVDTGLARSEIREQLEDALADHGYAFEDVDDVVITHHHGDHAGLAGLIQERSGATVYVHEADAPLVAGDADAHADMEALQRERFDEWNLPGDKLDELLAAIHRPEAAESRNPDVEPLSDGDRISVGGYDLATLHAPGHALGACCFEFEGDRGTEAFTGDALLPKYTPNVGGADVRVERPLEQYLDTLHTIVEKDWERAWPGHRDVIDDPTGRAEFIVEHHQERTEKVLDILSEHGPADAWTVSAHLFGELRYIHILHGPGEAYAHLDHLARHDIVSVEDGRYDIAVSEIPDLDPLFSAVTQDV